MPPLSALTSLLSPSLSPLCLSLLRPRPPSSPFLGRRRGHLNSQTPSLHVAAAPSLCLTLLHHIFHHRSPSNAPTLLPQPHLTKPRRKKEKTTRVTHLQPLSVTTASPAAAHLCRHPQILLLLSRNLDSNPVSCCELRLSRNLEGEDGLLDAGIAGKPPLAVSGFCLE